MNSLLKITWAASLTLGLTAGAAGAATIAPGVNVFLVDTSTNGVGNQAGTFGAGFSGTTPAGAAWFSTVTGGSAIAAPLVTPPPANLDNVYLSPFANTSLDSTTYFSVGAVGDADGDAEGPEGGTSPAVLRFASDQSLFRILWGSIDSYNTLSFFNNGSLVASLTGTQLVSLFSLPGSPANYNQVASLVFGFDSGYDAIRFTSPQAAFEFAISTVPLPAAAWMLIAAISGLGFVARRSRQAAA